MLFRKHSEYEGRHAALSASKSAWLNYTDERLMEYVEDMRAAARGTKLHELARMSIELRKRQQNTSETINAYINDCIGYGMKPEQILFYSHYAFGTADAIGFRKEKVDPDSDEEVAVLRIFDLKTGKRAVKGTQLVIYAAFFCLEYNVKPFEIIFDLRIYQNDSIIQIDVEPEDVVRTMSQIVEASKLLTERLEEV